MKTNAPIHHAAAPNVPPVLAPRRAWGPALAGAPDASRHDFAAVSVHPSAPATTPASAPIQRGKKDKEPEHRKLGRQGKRLRDRLPEDVRRGAHAYKAATRMGADESLNASDMDAIRASASVEAQHREEARRLGDANKDARREKREAMKASKPSLPRDPAALEAIIQSGKGDVPGARKLLNALKKRARQEESDTDEEEAS